LASVNSTQLRRFPTAIPPIPEQRKIAEILTTWDETLEKLDTLIAAQERRKHGLTQQLLTGRRSVGLHGRAAWSRLRMGQILERVSRPIAWSPDLPLALVSLRRRNGGVFRRPDVRAAEYKTHDLHQLAAGDFLISKRQVVHGAWGLVAPEFAGCHVSKEYAILVVSRPERLYMPFFGWLAQTPRMLRLARVASTGVHIEKLIFDPEVFLREQIAIPESLPEQRAIAAILDTCDAELRLLRAQRAALDRQKRGLMQRLLTGRVRVKVPGVSRR
jgi:type I restriction enzyme S subunit